MRTSDSHSIIHFSQHPILHCAGKKLDLTSPQVMGILNLSPNSFSSVGRFISPAAALTHAHKLVKEGAAIIDVGGEATNPGVHPIISAQEEIDRVIPVIELLCKEIEVPLSLDSSKPEVMQAALSVGINFINDVRGLSDPLALSLIAKANVPVCIMHMEFPYGKSDATIASYNDETVVDEVKNFLQRKIQICLNAGIARHNLIIDPGIGHGNFGKTTKQNLLLLQQLDRFLDFGLPVLIGVSRKTFIGELLNLPEAQRLAGSLSAAVIAVSKGAKIIRAHDVKETVEAIKIATAVMES